jgi:hypothetical protein
MQTSKKTFWENEKDVGLLRIKEWEVDLHSDFSVHAVCVTW